jgi:hypothetical protein
MMTRTSMKQPYLELIRQLATHAISVDKKASRPGTAQKSNRIEEKVFWLNILDYGAYGHKEAVCRELPENIKERSHH